MIDSTPGSSSAEVKKYVCTQKFVLSAVDDNGFDTGKYVVIEEGSVWERTDDPYRFIGGYDTVRLIGKNCSWLEIAKERLEVYFKEVDSGEDPDNR